MNTMLLDKMKEVLKRTVMSYSEGSLDPIAKELEQVAIKHHLSEIDDLKQQLYRRTMERDEAAHLLKQRENKPAERHTFRTALFFWQPDFVRGERVNLGIVLVSPQTKFCKARFVTGPELLQLSTLFPTSGDVLAWYAEVLQQYEEIAERATVIGGDRPLRFDHPFVFAELFGRSGETSPIQWHNASSGLLRKSPQEELNEMFALYVQRAGRP